MSFGNTLGMGALLAGLSVSGFAQDGVDPYYSAIRNNDMAALSALVKAGGVNGKDKRGSTPLHYSAAYGSLESMRALLAAGAEVNVHNDFDTTPLMWSASEPEKVRLLVAKGADVNAHSKMGRTALYLAAANDGSSATVKFLLEHGAKVDGKELLAAANANDMASVRLLLDAGADAKVKAENGATPLFYAAAGGNLKMTETLLGRGADVNTVTKGFGGEVKNGKIALDGLTPLMMSVNGPVEVVRALLDAGAKVNAQDIRDMTPLMLAVTSDHTDPRVVKLLVERGADLKIKDREGLTAGDWAKKGNNPAILRELGSSSDKTEAQAARVIIPAKLLEQADPRAAAAKSIALLQRASGDFFKQGGCGSCHSQNMTSIAVNAAAANRVPVNLEAKAAELKGAQLGLSSFEQPLLQRGDPPVPEILSYGLLQLASENAPADRTTDAMVHNLMAQQLQAGNWHVGGIPRPPAEDADFTRTATAIRGLRLYGPAGRKAEVQKRVDRAAAWLAATNPKTTEDLSMQLMGLKWAGVAKKSWQGGLQRLIAQQREDGGWAQTADLASDAYATGEVLFTMHELGVPASDPAWRKGVQYLIQTQQADGSWYVKSRSPKFQPYFTTIFPHEHDQWISTWATAWAATALSYASGPTQTAAR